MEYQSRQENGQVQWYNLVGDSEIPEKVRICKCQPYNYNMKHICANSFAVVILPFALNVNRACKTFHVCLHLKRNV